MKAINIRTNFTGMDFSSQKNKQIFSINDDMMDVILGIGSNFYLKSRAKNRVITPNLKPLFLKQMVMINFIFLKIKRGKGNCSKTIA